MLPPRLAKVLEQLEERPSTEHSQEERELLDELRELDRVPEVTAIARVILSKMARIVSGPSDRCPCCGR